MRKSLALQAELAEESGSWVFEVTLDCEDGAPVGGNFDHANVVVALILEAWGKERDAWQPAPRIAVRVHPVDHPAFEQDVQTIVAAAGSALCHLMVPKVESVRDVDLALSAIDGSWVDPWRRVSPLHVLLESPAAVHCAFDIAAHPRVQSISFGLMDFVSAHGGANPAHDMSGAGQFTHPLVMRAKLEISSACHAYGKVPSHCVVTEFRELAALAVAARTAARELGYTRMSSIHPGQIRSILSAFDPAEHEIAIASEIIARAQQVDWAPLDFRGQLHDRASYRFSWQLLEPAYQTGQVLPHSVQHYFMPPMH